MITRFANERGKAWVAASLLLGLALTGCHRPQRTLPREAVHPWPPVFGSADRGATPLHHSFRSENSTDLPESSRPPEGGGSASEPFGYGAPVHPGVAMSESGFSPTSPLAAGAPHPSYDPLANGSVDLIEPWHRGDVRPVSYEVGPQELSMPSQSTLSGSSRVSAAPIGGVAAAFPSTAEPIRFVSQDTIEAAPELEAIEPAPTEAAPVQLEDVFASVLAHYPLLVLAELERGIAAGQVVSRWGEFDTRIKGYTLDRPVGFYENYRQGLGFDQPLFSGGYVTGGYRLGDGAFEPWYKERETNEGGELSLAVGFPLLKGRVIDERRAELLRATLALQTVEPVIRTQMIASLREGAFTYWDWFAAGRSVDAHRRLLSLAETRIEKIESLIEAGDQPPVVRLDNRRLLASRQAKSGAPLLLRAFYVHACQVA